VTYFLGIDGGQSSTTALIGDGDGNVAGYGRGGPCNHVSGSEARTKFLGAIGTCVRAAAGQAGLASDAEGRYPFAAACSGFSGGAKDKAHLLDEIFLAEAKLVTHDALIALAGATGGEPGVMVISGTGSIAFARDAEGRTIRAGGWGYIYGDEGWGPATSLRAKLLAATGVQDVDDLMHRFYTPEFARPQIAAMSKLVDEAAAEGDAVASEIIRKAAESLAGYARAARTVAFGAESTIPVRCVGGGFQSERMRNAFSSLIEAAPPKYLPAAGALLEAYRIGGLPHMQLKNVPEFEK
jgi:N-acetylglucosamine kinase-like BadF-type ATPase